jgi:glutamine synthetase
MPEKGQQLEDHYFGSIPTRIQNFMVDFETECYKLGIPLKTRHNEVAPSQYECAPNFEEANLAIDHNQLLMDMMDKVAERHGLKVLLHEKPFAGVNGSGKHNNWSLITNTGVNLLSPGKTPQNNLQFLTIFINVIKAVYDNADLLRASIASAANDHRLGANEAPPAIMSVFIGTQLTSVLEEMISTKVSSTKSTQAKSSINVKKIPEILLDNTDRNRTSPFAFTGNKFEFRAVGSSANCANSMIVLNAIMADQLNKFKKEVDAQITKGKKKEDAILDILKSYYKTSRSILFEGNGYSDAWVKEAAKRGLSNIKTTPSALNAYITPKSKKVFSDNDVFNTRELEARYEIMQENYVKKIDIEAKVIGQLAISHVIPAALNYQQKLSNNVASLKSLGLPKITYEAQLKFIQEVSKYVKHIRESVEKMIAESDKAHHIEDTHKRALAFCNKVKPLFDEIRNSSDALEFIIEDELWKLPKYRELLFIK